MQEVLKFGFKILKTIQDTFIRKVTTLLDSFHVQWALEVLLLSLYLHPVKSIVGETSKRIRLVRSYER